MGYKKYDKAINSFFKGIKSTARTTNRIVKAVDKANRLHRSEVAQRYKQQQKATELANAQQEVQLFEDYISLLQSVHKECSENIDWLKIKSNPAPEQPKLMNLNEQQSCQAFQSYKPNFFDKLFKQEIKKRQKLEQRIAESKQKDLEEYKQQCDSYETDLAEWQGAQSFSEAILSKEADAYKRAIEEFEPFSDLDGYGSKLEMKFASNYIAVEYYVNDKEVIPSEEKKLTSTGKLTVKALSKSRFNEIYQDYVCSCILRVAREVLAIIPINAVIVNAIGSTINSKTGNLEDVPIVSVLIKRQNLSKLNFEALDPSDSMQNFITNMKFSKTNGFQAVDRIVAENLILES